MNLYNALIEMIRNLAVVTQIYHKKSGSYELRIEVRSFCGFPTLASLFHECLFTYICLEMQYKFLTMQVKNITYFLPYISLSIKEICQ